MNTNIKVLTTDELIYLAEYMICVLDCRARNDDEYATPDNLIKDNLAKISKSLTLSLGIYKFISTAFDFKWYKMG